MENWYTTLGAPALPPLPLLNEMPDYSNITLPITLAPQDNEGPAPDALDQLVPSAEPPDCDFDCQLEHGRLTELQPAVDQFN